MNVKEKKSTTDAVESPKTSIGRVLKQAREGLGLSAPDIAEHLRLPLRVIQAIEQDKHAVAEMNAFIRGYIRSYARFVKIPMKEIDEFFSQAGISIKRIRPNQVVSVASSKRKKIRVIPLPATRMRWITYLISGILIGFVGLWLYAHHGAVHEISTPIGGSSTPAVIDIPAASAPSAPTELSPPVSPTLEQQKEAKAKKNMKKMGGSEEAFSLNPTDNTLTREWTEPR